MGNSLSPYQRSLLNARVRMSDRRIERATADDDTFLGIDIGKRVDPKDAERLFGILSSRFDQIAADQTAALDRQTLLTQRSLRQQRAGTRQGLQLQRQLLVAQRAGVRQQERMANQDALYSLGQNRLLANFNINQRNAATSDYLKEQGQQSFFLSNALKELMR